MRARREARRERRSSGRWRWWRVATAALIAPAVLAGVGAAVLRARAHGTDDAERSLQEALDDLRGRMGITQPVRVTVVARNPHVFSARPADARGVFEIQVEAGILEQLTPDELHAALAHELGHVWIYSNHPYLQTERLANDVARRAVSRDALARLYEKVWSAQGVKGTLARFLGE